MQLIHFCALFCVILIVNASDLSVCVLFRVVPRHASAYQVLRCGVMTFFRLRPTLVSHRTK